MKKFFEPEIEIVKFNSDVECDVLNQSITGKDDWPL